jgi:hypothetical protein
MRSKSGANCSSKILRAGLYAPVSTEDQQTSLDAEPGVAGVCRPARLDDRTPGLRDWLRAGGSSAGEYWRPPGANRLSELGWNAGLHAADIRRLHRVAGSKSEIARRLEIGGHRCGAS